jgi:F-type H+-transporting ATPase subunit epsilon
MRVVLATVTRKVLEEECQAVVLPTRSGEIEVLDGHAPLLTQLAPGIMRVKRAAGAQEAFVVDAGFAQTAAGVLLIIAEVAEQKHQVVLEAARRERDQAERRLKEGGLKPEEIVELYRRQRLNRARLQLAGENSGAAVGSTH